MEKNKKDWYLYFPCGYTDAEDEIQEIDIKDKNQKIFMIDGCDYIVSKFTLWTIMKNKYGRKIAASVLPNSFISSKKKDLKDFWVFYDNQLKKNRV